MDRRQLFLSSNRYRNEWEDIEKNNVLLTSENKQLEKELTQEEKRNETLTIMREERELNYSEREKNHMEEIESKQKNIALCNLEYEASKGMREQLQELAKEKGFL